MNHENYVYCLRCDIYTRRQLPMKLITGQTIKVEEPERCAWCGQELKPDKREQSDG